MFNINFNCNLDLINYLENSNDSSVIIKTILISVVKKILCRKNNFYNKINFLENLVKTSKLKKILINFFIFNKEETKQYFIINIFNNKILPYEFKERYCKFICNLFENKYDRIIKFYIILIKEEVYKYNQKGQNIFLDEIKDLENKFKHQNFISHLTEFCIVLFNKIQIQDFRISKYNKNLTENSLFTIIIRLLEYGLINDIEELHMRNLEKEEHLTDIAYFDSINFEMKKELEERILNEKEQLEKTELISINETLIEEYYYLINVITKRIEYLKKQTNFFSSIIDIFINWLFENSNLLLNNQNILEYSNSQSENIINLILVYKKNIIVNGIDLQDNKVIFFLKFIANIHSNKNIKNPDILIKSLDLLKFKLKNSSNENYINSIIFNYKLWCKIFISSTCRLRNNNTFILYTLPFLHTVFNEFIKKKKNIFTYIEHTFKQNELHLLMFLTIKVLKYNLKKSISLYSKIKNEKTTINNFFMNVENLLEFNEYFNNIECLYFFLNNVYLKNTKLLLGFENRNNYIEFLNLYVETIIEKKYNFTINTGLFYMINKYITTLLDNIFKNNIDKIIDIYSSEFLEFKKNKWIEFLNYLKKNDILTFYLNSNTVERISNIIENNKKKYSNLDNKFIDPITQTLIEEPVCLSDNIIVDKFVICKHLIENEYNPYNREYLTIKILEKYNKKSENVRRLIDFKMEFSERLVESENNKY